MAGESLEPLGYATPTRSASRAVLRQIAVAIAVVAGCVLLIVAVVAIRLALFVHEFRSRVRAFDQKTAAIVVVGKTPQQIIALFGTPYFDTNNDPPGTWHPQYEQRLIVYEDGTGETARIVVNGGVATEVTHYGK
jgi:hypothetical protein